MTTLTQRRHSDVISIIILNQFATKLRRQVATSIRRLNNVSVPVGLKHKNLKKI